MDWPKNHDYMITTIIQSYFWLIIIFVHSNKILQKYWMFFLPSIAKAQTQRAELVLISAPNRPPKGQQGSGIRKIKRKRKGRKKRRRVKTNLKQGFKKRVKRY